MGFTARKSMKLVLVGGAVAATALLSACSGNNVDGNGAAAKSISDAAAVKQNPQGGSGGAAGTAATSDGDVNCSKLGGQVGPAGGKQMDLIAVESADGSISGCVEAFNVMQKYYELAPAQGEGPGHRVLGIEGHWDCALGAEEEFAQGVVNCGKDGGTRFMIKTAPAGGAGGQQPAAPTRRFPNTTQTVQFTGFDRSVAMAQFQLITWKKGGPDDGQFAPADAKTYRLPLSKTAQVFGAAELCPGGDVALDSQGRGTNPCTEQALMEALTGAKPLHAEIHVDKNDNIDVVKELYRP
ncbi:hypothetical protein CU254_04660 [Amycolatopsis sp. AA4]|uniref:hypothetical protein n=1 Tax=Actinomycetes TaxID=1760 RepID=UPI0001B57A1D|nr:MULTISPECIES: hypothetical protein [Actinomycetes]ATY09831.1 hypothetical protein CU254_04660 [Amycolatopsis sp. AA4]EFL05235.1 predicted protein [Streptomyces sp. AA4]